MKILKEVLFSIRLNPLLGKKKDPTEQTPVSLQLSAQLVM
jgi:hypothetical protein